MATLFNEENSDSESKLKINSGYANNYDTWRQKEELHKFKTKYGDCVQNGQSSGEDSETSSDEDEEGAELTEELEKKFYKTLACLKNKDPKIYDEKVAFFDADSKKTEESSRKKSPKEKKLFLRDYEREIVTERGGQLSDSEDEDTLRRLKRKTAGPTYVEEQLALKESISKALDDEDEAENDDLLVPKVKSESETLKEDETYREWLKGRKDDAENSDKEDLKPLRDFWTDPNLDPKEKFLRDYVLNKKFLATDDCAEYGDLAHESDVDLSEDEKNIETQEEFEHKYNFRFEEPDQEFIKRYPRTLENSLRKKDNRRAQKRAEIKDRKEADKIRKQEELKQLKALKRKEIADKIAQLREITGNNDLQFDNIDLDGDFDPAEHDRKMQEIFNEDYYAVPDGDLKPEFPEIDEELGIERTWDDYDPEHEEIVPDNDMPRARNTHCEDPGFNMDADYDPIKALQDELVDNSRKKKKRRRSKFAEVIAKEKPKFDPKLHASYRNYIEQYYALDYEDMIDDLPCRFKYREVVPNDYGLSVEEILVADDRELNKWCSLKKALEHKPENIQLREVEIYRQKSRNEAFKKKVLKSLYTPDEEPQDPETTITPAGQEDDESKKKRKKKKKKKVKTGDERSAENKSEEKSEFESQEKESNVSGPETPEVRPEKKIPRSPKKLQEKREEEKAEETRSPAAGKKKKRKVPEDGAVPKESKEPELTEPPAKKAKSENITANGHAENSQTNSTKKDKKKKKKKKKGAVQDVTSGVAKTAKNTEKGKAAKKKKKNQSASVPQGKKFKKAEKEKDQVALMSSERLKAYGLNPKKFKNKLKYGK